MSVRAKLVIGSVLQFVVIAAMLGGVLWTTARARHYEDLVREALSRVQVLHTLHRDSDHQLAAYSEYVRSGGTTGEFKDYEGKVSSELSSLEMLVTEAAGEETPDDQQKPISTADIKAFRSSFNSFNSFLEEAVGFYEGGETAQAAARFGEAQRIYDVELLPQIDTLIETEQRIVVAADSSARRASDLALAAIVIAAPLGLLITVIISFVVIRDITVSLDKLGVAAQQIGAGDLDFEVETGKNDEFGVLASTMNSMASDLRDSTEELKRYAHTVSHDLKGPLTSVMLASSMLTDTAALPGGDVMNVEELADIIDNGLRRCASLIDDLLALAEAGQKPIEVSAVDVKSVVDMVLDQNSADISEKGIVTEVDGDLGEVVANPTQVFQLFSNLIRNAIKYNDSAQPTLTISYRGRDGDGTHRYVVCDNGSGVPEDLVENIFKPFFKGNGGGTGIGLATVKRIVETYCGSISARNEGGACFEFTLKDIEPLSG